MSKHRALRDYNNLHYWVNKNKPKPLKCEHCDSEKKLDWANISHNYTQDLDDWVALCRSCHMKFDGVHTLSSQKVSSIISLRSVGATVSEICRIIGVSAPTVSKHARYLSPVDGHHINHIAKEKK